MTGIDRALKKALKMEKKVLVMEKKVTADSLFIRHEFIKATGLKTKPIPISKTVYLQKV